MEHLKKENASEYRFISLTDVAKKIIRKARELNPDGEFIFKRNGERLTARAVTYWPSKYCRDAGITYKSTHCTSTTKNPLIIKGFRKRETGFEFYPLVIILIERDFLAHPIFTYSIGYSKLKVYY